MNDYCGLCGTQLDENGRCPADPTQECPYCYTPVDPRDEEDAMKNEKGQWCHRDCHAREEIEG